MALNFVFEGLEGSGKSLDTVLLTETLEKTTDFPVMAVREPGGSKVGSMIRYMLLEGDDAKNMHPRTRMLLYSADRNELLEKTIFPFNAEHPDGITIGDRSWASTLALQIADGAESDYTQAVQDFFISRYPSKFFLLDIHEEEAMVRLHASKYRREINWRDKMPIETYAVHRRNYLDLAKRYPEKFVLIDGFKMPWEIIYETRNHVLSEVAQNPNLRDRALKAIDEFAGEKFDSISAEIRERVNYKGFNEEGILDAIETSRKELGARPPEVLRAEMHEDWRALGLEGCTSGIERGK